MRDVNTQRWVNALPLENIFAGDGRKTTKTKIPKLTKLTHTHYYYFFSLCLISVCLTFDDGATTFLVVIYL
jgi:hypothetical protein